MRRQHLHTHFLLTVLLLFAAMSSWVASPAHAQGTTVTSSIADGATGVAVNVPIVFTFSKAIDTEETTTMFYHTTPTFGTVEVTLSWAAGNTQLTCTPVGGNWPAQTQIQWMLTAVDVDGEDVTIPPLGMPPMGAFTTGTGGGTTDTDPPVLVPDLCVPTNNATAVPVNRTIKFVFNETMQTTRSIQWSANLTPAKFTYAWGTDARTLRCTYAEHLPANATITWKLNPTGATELFKDTAGNALAANVSGSFTTSDKVDPCGEQEEDPRGSFSVTWYVMYAQSGSGAPVQDPETLPFFTVTLLSPTNNPVTGAQLGLPGGSSITITNLFGSMFMNAEEYASQAALDAARPAGNYTLQATRSSGSQSLTVSHQAADWPPTPQILNLPALQNADASSAVVVQWNGFTGAGANDSISFTLDLGGGEYFVAPDPCAPIVLEKTATSITLPSNLMVAGRTYNASLTYHHLSTFDTNTIPDIIAMSGTTKDLNFQIVTGSGSATSKSPTLGNPTVTGGALEFAVTGAASGQSLQLQESSTLAAGSWTAIQTTAADASGGASFSIPVGATGSKFYRLYTP